MPAALGHDLWPPMRGHAPPSAHKGVTMLFSLCKAPLVSFRTESIRQKCVLRTKLVGSITLTSSYFPKEDVLCFCLLFLTCYRIPQESTYDQTCFTHVSAKTWPLFPFLDRQLVARLPVCYTQTSRRTGCRSAVFYQSIYGPQHHPCTDPDHYDLPAARRE